jgi:hypothetical protein
MNEFNYEEWRKNKELEATCSHEQYRVELTETTNGNPLRRFYCTYCNKKEPSLQLATSDVNRVIASVKHPGKTLQEIADVDTPYLYWVAVKSKMPQMDRYACARILAKKPYVVPEGDAIIPRGDLYYEYVMVARNFIRDNGGEI